VCTGDALQDTAVKKEKKTSLGLEHLAGGEKKKKKKE